jgi:transposase InsO family protein
MVRSGKTVTEVARYFGYSKGAVSKWCRKSPVLGSWVIPTESSRPHRHPKQLSDDTVTAIIQTKLKYRRCSEVIHAHLKKQGVVVSLNSVKRKLDYAGLIKKRSAWKRLHLSVSRPEVVKPGDLIQVDTIHIMETSVKRIYVYTLIDLCSRWTFAWASDRISARHSVKFLQMAQDQAPFTFRCIQSDNGSEFSQHFTERIKVLHRHSRVRRPNDNAHLERFNRTLQEECLSKVPSLVTMYEQVLPEYLKYYNTERLHLGLGLRTPISVI